MSLHSVYWFTFQMAPYAVRNQVQNRKRLTSFFSLAIYSRNSSHVAIWNQLVRLPKTSFFGTPLPTKIRQRGVISFNLMHQRSLVWCVNGIQMFNAAPVVLIDHTRTYFLTLSWCVCVTSYSIVHFIFCHQFRFGKCERALRTISWITPSMWRS